MNYIPKDKRERVGSLLKECSEHIQHVLNTRVLIKLTMVPAVVDEELIKQQVCESFEVSWDDICSNKRYSNIVNARMCYSYLVRTYLNKTLDEIGNAINKDHTSVVHHVAKVMHFLQVDGDIIQVKLTPIINYLNSINEPQEI